MRLLLDNCFSRRFAKRLRAFGHDVLWMGDLGPDPGDPMILALAFAERRVLITRDNDFGKLIFKERQPHAGLIRLRELTVAESLAVCKEALELYEAQLAAGAIVVGGPRGLRLRPPGEPE